MAGSRVVIGLSFGYGEKDALGISNRMLIEGFWKHHPVIFDNAPMLLQEELFQCVQDFPTVRVELIIRANRDGTYLDTETVLRKAMGFAKRHSYTEVLILAHPFLHRRYTVQKARAIAGGSMKIKALKTGWVPFDSKSYQWWTRSPFHLLAYALRTAFTGRHGP